MPRWPSSFGALALPAVALLALAPWTGAAAAGDAAAGADLFKSECAECHSVRPGKNKKGPSLAGIVGRSAATVADFEYSAALKATGWVWTEERLRTYLSGPVSQTNPGGKMKYEGLASAHSRDDMLAYLQTLKP